MSKTIVAAITDGELAFTGAPSDRYVYSNYFIPVLMTFEDGATPLLPFYVKQQLIELQQHGLLEPNRVTEILRQLGLDQLWTRNAMVEAAHRYTSSGIFDPGESGISVPQRSAVTRPSVLGGQDAEFIAGLLQSQVGVVFLDRTQIRPVGFALGEHVYALALAPGEEVTLEQKTFSKRQVTLEEQDEQEKQFDIELSSSLSTELQEGLERQQSHSVTHGLHGSHTGQYSSPFGLPWGSIVASHTLGSTHNIADANQEAARVSVKNGQTASSKVAAKYRTQHKTSFRLVTEEGFESTSKRRIKNPNRTTPITLHYFKVLERLELRQERYGVRLGWAPSIKDPGRTFADKILKGRKAIIDAAITTLPPLPGEPKPSGDGTSPGTTVRETKTLHSAVEVAHHWNPDGGMLFTYDVNITHDLGWTWNGDTMSISNTITLITQRPNPDSTILRIVQGTPYTIYGEVNNKLRVKVLISAPPWLGGPGIWFQVHGTFTKDVTIVGQVRDDTKYNDDLATWRTQLTDWTTSRDAALAAAEVAAAEFEKRLVAGLNPINEMIGQLIEQHFPASVRDECWEIDYWQRLFDWERASFVAYPSWWSNSNARHPLLDPSDFLNASWAKLYLPVRVGMEILALRWMFGKTVATPLSRDVEARFVTFVDELRKFRGSVLGAPEELEELTERCQAIKDPSYCMAKWSELLPSDGTHIEVVQGATSSADAITGLEIADAAALRAALVESEKRSAALKDKALDRMSDPATVEVQIGAGTPTVVTP